MAWQGCFANQGDIYSQRRGGGILLYIDHIGMSPAQRVSSSSTSSLKYGIQFAVLV